MHSTQILVCFLLSKYLNSNFLDLFQPNLQLLHTQYGAMEEAMKDAIVHLDMYLLDLGSVILHTFKGEYSCD